MSPRRLLPVVVAALVGLVAGGCTFAAEGETITVEAVFDDVIDLVTEAHVRAGDVPIGTVTGIELTEELEARVTMEIEADTGLPADTAAFLAKTSLLGERYIDLRPQGEGGALEDGQVIRDTAVVTDFEDFVRSGNEVLAFVAADALAAAIQTGAEAFGGRGGLIGQFVGDVEAVIGRFDERSEVVTTLIDRLDEFTATLAPSAETNAAGFTELARLSQALSEEDERLLDALDELTRLARVGERILEANAEDFDESFRRLDLILSQVTRIDGAFQDLLTWVPRHNLHVPNGIVDEHAQVWLDFIVCGENEREDDQTRDCTPPNPSESPDRPPFHPHSEDCWESHAACPGTQRDEQESSP